MRRSKRVFQVPTQMRGVMGSSHLMSAQLASSGRNVCVKTRAVDTEQNLNSNGNGSVSMARCTRLKSKKKRVRKHEKR